MIVAIPASDKNIDSLIDERFARCDYFCMYNTETQQIDFKENNLKVDSSGVGPQVVEFLANNSVNSVYAMEFGPKAKEMLDKLGIETQIVNNKKAISEIIELLNN